MTGPKNVNLYQIYVNPDEDVCQAAMLLVQKKTKLSVDKMRASMLIVFVQVKKAMDEKVKGIEHTDNPHRPVFFTLSLPMGKNDKFTTKFTCPFDGDAKTHPVAMWGGNVNHWALASVSGIGGIMENASRKELVRRGI